jgi:opacity protein-like surface antigen
MNNIDSTFVNAPHPRARGGHARLALVLTLSFTVGGARAAHAETASSLSVAGPAAEQPAGTLVSTTASPATLASPDTVQPCSLPWELRPVTTGNVFRLDSAAAVFNDANGNLDEAVTTVLAASYQITRRWAPMIRLGFVGNDAPGAALDGDSFVNPVVGATYTRNIDRTGRYRVALFGATTIPIGTGGGNAPDPGAAKTNVMSTTARPADDAMFAVNYMTEIMGADVAYVNHGFTAQAEATLQQFIRVRGDHGAGSTDSFRTNSGVGVQLGYFIGSRFSLSGDLLYRRWLSHPNLDAMPGAHVPLSDANMDTITVAAGPRLHFRLGTQVWIRPGISFVRGLDARGIDAPLLTARTTAVQIDIPVTF